MHGCMAAGAVPAGASGGLLTPSQGLAVQLRANWQAFWTAVFRDHSHAGLVWSEATRSELRAALQVWPFQHPWLLAGCRC